MDVTRKQLDPPTKCDSCDSYNFKLCHNSEIYGKPVGRWPYVYYCLDCKASVGCHPNTYNPLGTMANSATRRKRSYLHSLFDPIWQLGYLSRFDAYKWLAKFLDIENQEDCHIAIMRGDQLVRAIIELKTHKQNNYLVFRRRKEKSYAKRVDQRIRQNTKIGIRKSGNYRPKNSVKQGIRTFGGTHEDDLS